MDSGWRWALSVNPLKIVCRIWEISEYGQIYIILGISVLLAIFIWFQDLKGSESFEFLLKIRKLEGEDEEFRVAPVISGRGSSSILYDIFHYLCPSGREKKPLLQTKECHSFQVGTFGWSTNISKSHCSSWALNLMLDFRRIVGKGTFLP